MSDATHVTVSLPDVTVVEITENDVTIVHEQDGTKLISTAEVGPRGPRGLTAIHVGPTPPSDTVLLWVDTTSPPNPTGRAAPTWPEERT